MEPTEGPGGGGISRPVIRTRSSPSINRSSATANVNVPVAWVVPVGIVMLKASTAPKSAGDVASPGASAKLTSTTVFVVRAAPSAYAAVTVTSVEGASSPSLVTSAVKVMAGAVVSAVASSSSMAM